MRLHYTTMLEFNQDYAEYVGKSVGLLQELVMLIRGYMLACRASRALIGYGAASCSCRALRALSTPGSPGP